MLPNIEPHTKKDETDWINLVDEVIELALLSWLVRSGSCDSRKLLLHPSQDESVALGHPHLVGLPGHGDQRALDVPYLGIGFGDTARYLARNVSR